jgi:polyhydroxyalkanoate synthesis regulator phasin
MEIMLDTVRKLIVQNADYEREIERLIDDLQTAYADGRASRDEEVDALRAELAQLKMPAAA